MPDNTFDVVSKIEMPEVINAVQQAAKEVQTRFDLKDSKSEIQLNEKDHKIVLASIDEFRRHNVVACALGLIIKLLENACMPRVAPTLRVGVGTCGCGER